MEFAPTTARRCSAWIAIAILASGPCAFAASAPSDPRTDARSDARTARSDARTPAAAFAELVAARSGGNPAECEAALVALAGFPHALVRAAIESAAARDRSDEDARAGLAVLERIGLAGDLPLAPILWRPGSEEELEHAVLSIARRDARSLTVLEGLARAVAPEVRIAFVHAVEGLGTIEAVSWMARCAERLPDVRSEALARLGRLAQGLPYPAPDDALAVVRGNLAGFGSESLRDAVIAAGRMEDGESIPHLIALLREEDAGLRADAAWSLERISGLHLRDRADRWEDWYEVELDWWRERSDAAFAELESRDRAACTCALLEIAGRRMSRDRLSLRVAPLLEDADPWIAQLAAQTLRTLRSKVACAALVVALERPEPEIGLEAWRALRSITRKDLPRDVEAWRSVFGR